MQFLVTELTSLKGFQLGSDFPECVVNSDLGYARRRVLVEAVNKEPGCIKDGLVVDCARDDSLERFLNILVHQVVCEIHFTNFTELLELIEVMLALKVHGLAVTDQLDILRRQQSEVVRCVLKPFLRD